MELLLDAVLEVFVLFGDTIGAAVAEKLADSNSLSRLPRWLRIILSIVGGTLFVAALFALGMLCVWLKNECNVILGIIAICFVVILAVFLTATVVGTVKKIKEKKGSK